MDNVARYFKALNRLLAARGADGGLALECESQYVEELDDLWWTLTEDQQSAVEKELTALDAD